MAQLLKRCDHTRDQWAKCPHSWTVRYWADGAQREKSFKRNYSQAKAFATTVEAGKLSVHRGDPRPITFREYSEAWLDSHHGSASTRRIYGAAMRGDLIPRFGGRQLADVAADREGVTALLNSLTPSASRLAYTTLRACLSEAVRAGRLHGTRLAGIRLAAPTERLEFTFPTHDQLTILAEKMPEELRPSIWIMRGCGLRLGECLAVRGDAFSDGRLRISEQQLAADDSRAPLKARKPGEYRDVPVPEYVSRVLPGTPGYLFDVERWRYGRIFRAAAEAAGLDDFTPHGLRHVFASVALLAGVPITDVSRWLGHRNIQITYATYSHFIPSAWDKARAALDSEYETWSKAAS